MGLGNAIIGDIIVLPEPPFPLAIGLGYPDGCDPGDIGIGEVGMLLNLDEWPFMAYPAIPGMGKGSGDDGGGSCRPVDAIKCSITDTRDACAARS
jgi:hypothetical protein